jgi:transcriptional regulator with XRE-family HTH domain
MKNYKSKEFELIDLAMRTKLVKMGRTQTDLSKAMGISPQLLNKYCRGRVVQMTAKLLEDAINEGISRL